MVNIIASYTEWWPVYYNGEQIGKIVGKYGGGWKHSSMLCKKWTGVANGK